MKLKRVFHLINTDIIRFARETGIKKITFLKRISLLLFPCILSIALHRFSNYFYVNNHRFISRFFWTINFVLFSADIIPFADIGEYFYFPHPNGIGLMAKMGNNCTVFAQVGLGGGKSNDNIGAGKGTPIFGDNVVVGCGSKVLGPIKIGNNVNIGALALVIKDVPDNVTVAGIPARVISE